VQPDSRGKGRDRGWSIVENGVRAGNRQRCPRCGERSALSRVPGTVLADRFPANNWKCKRNRPPCDSSIIESLISVWMRPLSRFRALCPDRTPLPFCLSSSDAVSLLFLPPAIVNPFPSLSPCPSFTCWSASWRRILPTNDRCVAPTVRCSLCRCARVARQMRALLRLCTCASLHDTILCVFVY